MKKLLFILVVLPHFAFSQLVGKVVSVADGDTFTMLVDHKEIRIRLHGIDCPEKAQDFGQVAKKFLSDLVYRKIVSVKEMDIDRYGRTIGMVIIGDVNVNEELLKAGLAWHYTKYDQNVKWTQLEALARADKKGLWSKADPVPPWQWRTVHH